LLTCPLVVTNDPESRSMNSIFVKLTGNSIQQTVADIKTTWKDLGTDSPFNYTFLDSEIDKFYVEEQKMSKLIGLFSLLAILISCLGILGLSAYLAQRKNKEISIRKILGASLNQIVGILVKKTCEPDFDGHFDFYTHRIFIWTNMAVQLSV